MKKLKVSLIALALTIGVGAAFANRSAQSLNAKRFVNTWQDTNADGSLKLTSQGGMTYANQTAAEDATGCGTVVSTKCAASVNHPDGTETGSFIYKP